jgi:RHS repeat-associated protein
MLDGEGPLKAAPFYYQLDHLGTPQELTDYSGEIMWSAKYRAYGNLAALDIAEIDNPLRFQGQYFDAETGLHYNRHRYYNPGTGRFLTPDPIKLAGGLNNYQYVRNPTGWVDPLGLSECPGSGGTKSEKSQERSEEKSETNDGGPKPPVVMHDVDPNILNRTHSIEGKSSTKRVESIASDMRTNGFNKSQPIDVVEHDGSYYIIDGHHRAAAARRTHTPVSIRLITDLKEYGNKNYATTEDVLESAKYVGNDRLERPRR